MITVYQKNSFAIQLTVSEVDENNNKTPVDISDYTLTVIVKREDDTGQTDTFAPIKKVTNIGRTDDSVAGIVTINFNSSDTNIPKSTYNIQAELSIGTGVNTEYITIYDDQIIVKNNMVKQ